MANNYTDFSEVLPNLIDPELAWLRDQLQPIVVVSDQEHPADSLPDGINESQASWRGPRFLRGCDEETCGSDAAEFTHEFRLDHPEGKHGRYPWLHSEHRGGLDQVAILVQKLLRQFRPHDCWTLTYANTCSARRVGEFGGGAVIITADDIRVLDAQAIAEDACRAWNPQDLTGR